MDVRLVSATHKDLVADVKGGRFRQDLYYRLDVIEIVIPPLRERREDLPALCRALMTRIAAESGQSTRTLSAGALESLRNHPLQGNVRELENLLHRALALGENDGDALHLEFPALSSSEQWANASLDAATSIPPESPPVPQDLQAWLDQKEREILVKALRDSGFNRTAAAQRLGLSLRQIRYRIARLNIATPGSDDAGDDPT